MSDMLHDWGEIKKVLDAHGLPVDRDGYDLPTDPYGLDEARGTVVGDELVVGVLVNDDSDACNPAQENDGFGELWLAERGLRILELVNESHKRYPTRREHEAIVADAEEAQHIWFWVEKYEHGQVHFSVANTRGYPDRMWDVGVCGIFVPCDDVQRRYHKDKYKRGGKALARQEAIRDSNLMLQEYTNWCNGEVYGVVITVIDLATGEAEEVDSCCGYIGAEYAERELEDKVQCIAAGLAPAVAATA